MRAFLVGLLAAIAAGGSDQVVGSAPQSQYDVEILRPHLIDIGAGRRLNLSCVGQGAPTVVFQQGGEGSILDWKRVEGPIAALTRVCFYDRAGFGWSDPPQVSVTGLSETDDLHALLRKARIDLPVVMVGHSIGGFYATFYADRFIEDVAGIVLVEPGIADQYRPRTEAQRRIDVRNSARGDRKELDCARRAALGQMSLDHTRGCIGFPIMPETPEETAYISNMVSHPFWYRAEASQSQNYFFSRRGRSLDSRQERAVRRGFGDMPLIVLTADSFGANPWEGPTARAAREFDWRNGHALLAARSVAGQHITVPDSGHFIQVDQPQAVIEAVKQVVANARRRSHTAGPRP